MRIKNRIKMLVDRRGMSRYRFWQGLGTCQNTAYRLYDDCYYIPGAGIMEKLYQAYQWQPGDYLEVEK